MINWVVTFFAVFEYSLISNGILFLSFKEKGFLNKLHAQKTTYDGYLKRKLYTKYSKTKYCYPKYSC